MEFIISAHFLNIKIDILNPNQHATTRKDSCGSGGKHSHSDNHEDFVERENLNTLFSFIF